MNKYSIGFLIFILLMSINTSGQLTDIEREGIGKQVVYQDNNAAVAAIETGADQVALYLLLLEGKRVALLVNQTSEINGVLLPDTLLKLGVNVVKIFSPEHGFRGNADAGAKVKNGVDLQTGLPVVSLYGAHKKPTAEQLKDIDIVVFDLQDVGVRFYTYISSLEYLMEACAEQQCKIIVLDRPNPLGFIIDGPVLHKKHRSFVGMQPVPVVHGMTIGEYAKMLMGENWLTTANPDLTVIPCTRYTHQSRYLLPVPPSPNLKDMTAVYLYPSLCFFEGTVLSVGRGTDYPFQQFGHPKLRGYSYSFVPGSRPGATQPPLKDQECFGLRVAKTPGEALAATGNRINLQWLLAAYQHYPDPAGFFTPYFEKLSGTDLLRLQIQKGMTEAEIRASWQADLDHFKSIRSKYLLYAD